MYKIALSSRTRDIHKPCFYFQTFKQQKDSTSVHLSQSLRNDFSQMLKQRLSIVRYNFVRVFLRATSRTFRNVLGTCTQEINDVQMLAEVNHNLQFTCERANVSRFGGSANHLHCDCGDGVFLAYSLRFRLHHDPESTAAQLLPLI